MPTPAKSGCTVTALRNPTRMFRYSSRMFQCSPSEMRTGSLGKRCTSSRLSWSGRGGQASPGHWWRRDQLRPHTPTRSPQESGGDAGVDGNVQAGRVTEVSRAEHEDRVGDVLGEYLTLQQRSRGIVLAELLFRNPVDRGSLRTPATGEDAGATNHPIGVDAVHLHPVLP